jgi:CBS domain-containing protein
MRISQVMHEPVVTCGESDTLNRAAQLMWEERRGALPVVGGDGQLVGIVTDRDLCMAAYTQGRLLREIPVSIAMAPQPYCCHVDDEVDEVERAMAARRIRRVPVVDGKGCPVGLVTISDLARDAARPPNGKVDTSGLSARRVVETMTAIADPDELEATIVPSTEALARATVR